MDREVKRILTECYNDSVRLLTENRSLLDEISEHLLAKETITGDELMAFINAAKNPQPEEPAQEEPAQEADPAEE